MTEALRELIDTLSLPDLDDNAEVARKKLNDAIEKIVDLLLVKEFILEDLIKSLITVKAIIRCRAEDFEELGNKEAYDELCLVGSILDLQILSTLILAQTRNKKEK